MTWGKELKNLNMVINKKGKGVDGVVTIKTKVKT